MRKKKDWTKAKRMNKGEDAFSFFPHFSEGKLQYLKKRQKSLKASYSSLFFSFRRWISIFDSRSSFVFCIFCFYDCNWFYILRIAHVCECLFAFPCLCELRHNLRSICDSQLFAKMQKQRKYSEKQRTLHGFSVATQLCSQK